MSGDGASLGPFQDGAGLNFQICGGLSCGEPLAFHVENSILDAPVTQECLSVRYVFETAEKKSKIENIELYGYL